MNAQKFDISNVMGILFGILNPFHSNSVDEMPSIRYFEPRIRDSDWMAMEENKERGARLKEALGDRSNAWLAKQIGVVASTVHGYVHGKVPPADVALKICDVLDIDLRWYIDGQGVAVTHGDRLITLPLVDYDGQAPEGMSYAVSFLQHFVNDPTILRCMISSGVAMAPSIPEHAEIIFVPTDKAMDGAAHVVRVRQRLLVRRVRYTAAGELEAVCDNPAFVREGADLLDPSQIVGRVLWVGHKV